MKGLEDPPRVGEPRASPRKPAGVAARWLKTRGRSATTRRCPFSSRTEGSTRLGHDGGRGQPTSSRSRTRCRTRPREGRRCARLGPSRSVGCQGCHLGAAASAMSWTAGGSWPEPDRPVREDERGVARGLASKNPGPQPRDACRTCVSPTTRSPTSSRSCLPGRRSPVRFDSGSKADERDDLVRLPHVTKVVEAKADPRARAPTRDVYVGEDHRLLRLLRVPQHSRV